MNQLKQIEIFRPIMWDYNISVADINAVFFGEQKLAGHYTRDKLFVKILETYPWFTILEIFTPQQIQKMLTKELIDSLRMPSLRNKYEFVRERLQKIIPATE